MQPMSLTKVLFTFSCEPEIMPFFTGESSRDVCNVFIQLNRLSKSPMSVGMSELVSNRVDKFNFG